jgi:hypothetical protein
LLSALLVTFFGSLASKAIGVLKHQTHSVAASFRVESSAELSEAIAKEVAVFVRAVRPVGHVLVTSMFGEDPVVSFTVACCLLLLYFVGLALSGCALLSLGE